MSAMAYRHIVITGGCGFIGSTLCLRFKEAYSETRVTAIDNLSRKGSELNVPRLTRAGVTFVRGDVSDARSFSSAHDADLVIDCAANPSVMAGTDGSPLSVLEGNLWGTAQALEVARTSGAAFLFLSTSRVYPLKELCGIQLEEGDARFTLAPRQTIPGVGERGIGEDFPLGGPCTLYGATKLASEILIREYAAMFGVRAVISRFGVIAGPWQFGKSDQGLAALWMARHVFSQSLSYIGFGGHGKQVRDFLHVEDVWEAIRYQAEHMDELAGETFNLGGGAANSLSLVELTALCAEVSGHRIPIGSDEKTRPGDVPWYVSDYARFAARSGWKPKHDAASTLKDIHTWLLEHRAELEPIFRS